MSVRTIAFALPLVLGIACRTPGAPQGTARPGGASERTGSAISGHAHRASQGHAHDRVLSGSVSEVSDESVSILAPAGESRTLRIVPQTRVTVNGRVAPLTHVLPGQPVRASYAEHDGEAIAVRIDVGDATPGGAASVPTL